MPTAEERREYMRKWNADNHEHVLAYRRARTEQRNARRRERYAADAEYREQAKASARSRDKRAKRNGRLRAEFGITADEYDSMLAAQGGVCAICGVSAADARGHRLHVDHCHDTGRVRGILCGNCNLGLGKFGDDAARLGRAVDYLVRSER
jgi:hypothetical protein